MTTSNQAVLHSEKVVHVKKRAPNVAVPVQFSNVERRQSTKKLAEAHGATVLFYLHQKSYNPTFKIWKSMLNDPFGKSGLFCVISLQ